MIIDYEMHLFMEDQVIMGDSPSGSIVEHLWDENGMVGTKRYKPAADVNKYLKFMDEAGIDMAVLTSNFLTGLPQMKRWNDFCSGIVKAYPKRFAGYASIPVTGGKPALDELERAVKDLGLLGVHIWTWNDGITLDDRQMWPFYEKCVELDIPIDVHVTMKPPGYSSLDSDYALYFTIARELDMCAAVLRVCLGGVLEDFPNLKLIMGHFGGGISSMMERVDMYMNHIGPGFPSFYREKTHISKPWREYFNKLYFSMGGREACTASVESALTTISPDKLVFGTDWPFNYDYHPGEVRKYADNIRALNLPQQDIDNILGNNSLRLLKKS
ncbi:amidohydrolase family protein [Chloroflexota bacterium]